MGTSTASRMEAPSTGNEIEEGKKERKEERNKEMEKVRRWMLEGTSETCIMRLMALFTLKTELSIHFFPNLDGRTDSRRRRRI